MIKNTSDWNKEKIKSLEKRITLKDAMKFRSNIRFYKQDNIPSKKVIKKKTITKRSLILLHFLTKNN